MQHPEELTLLAQKESFLKFANRLDFGWRRMYALGSEDMTKQFRCRRSGGIFRRVEGQPITVKGTSKPSEILTMFLGRSAGYNLVADLGVDKMNPASGIINKALKGVGGIS